MHVKTLVVLAILAALPAAGCTSEKSGTANGNADPKGAVSASKKQPHKVRFESKYPSVLLTEYTLITDDLERDRAEADAVVHAKTGLPYAMHTKRREDFEAVLAANLVFGGGGEFFDRNAYIENRVGDPEKVRTAEYKNVAVQFITPDRALVTYSNVVENEPGGPGSWKAEMAWADILVKDSGRWLYETVHLVHFRDLTESD